MRHYLSIAAIIKNEALYLKEWIDFHIDQGVEHFYLYDNESTDNTYEVLLPYIDEGYVTWQVAIGKSQQVPLYTSTIYTKANETVWCAFIDVDEFLYCSTMTFSKKLYRDYDLPGNSVVAVHWLLFGSNGEEEYKPAPVIFRFTRRAASVNPHVKSVVKLQRAIKAVNPHAFEVRGQVIGEYHNVLPAYYALHEPATADILRINHYVTKSRAECARRRGDGNRGNSQIRADIGQPFIENFFAIHDCNDVFDDKILKWA